MFKKFVVVAAVGSIASVIGLASPAGADEPADWSLENCVDAQGKPTTKLESGAKCDLKNVKSGQCLVRESHHGQTDWDFASCSSKPREVQITAKDGAGAVNYNETVALKIGSEYFRKCHDPQLIGINICSEGGNPQAMHYEWQLQGGSGQVETGKHVALYNTTRKDSIVFAKRPSKMVDTCWANNIKFGQCTTVRDK